MASSTNPIYLLLECWKLMSKTLGFFCFGVKISVENTKPGLFPLHLLFLVIPKLEAGSALPALYRCSRRNSPLCKTPRICCCQVSTAAQLLLPPSKISCRLLPMVSDSPSQEKLSSNPDQQRAAGKGKVKVMVNWANDYVSVQDLIPQFQQN